MKKFLRIAGVVVGTTVAVILISYAFIYFDINNRIGKMYEVHTEPIHVTYDSLSIELGRRLVGIRACNDCHGEDLGGRVIHEDEMIGRVSSRNLTKGKGGLPGDYSEADWVRAMKHGVGRNGKPLLFMPANEFAHMSEKDMAAIIAYMSTIPEVDREDLPVKVGPLAYVLAEFDVIPLIPAEKVDHTIPFAKHVEPGVNIEYGKYLAVVCTNCHGPQLKGGGPLVPGGAPVPDLTATGEASKWTHDQFVNTLHTGIRPNGEPLKPDMPWKMTLAFTADELTAVHLYAQSIN